jgi:hypothetical protein
MTFMTRDHAAECGAETGVRHSAQYFAPATIATLQLPQRCSIGAPHSVQKRWASKLSRPQVRHLCIRARPLSRAERNYRRSSQ